MGSDTKFNWHSSWVHYDWVAEPKDPREKMLDVKDEAEPVRVKLEGMSNLSIVKFEVQAKNHALKEIKYVDSCVKVYSWIWILCTQATQDKLKTVPGFTDIEKAKDFIQLIVALEGIAR